MLLANNWTIEREVLAVSGGRIDRMRMQFIALMESVTRTLAANSENIDKPISLQGKTVLATRNGETWSYCADSPLSEAGHRHVDEWSSHYVWPFNTTGGGAHWRSAGEVSGLTPMQQ